METGLNFGLFNLKDFSYEKVAKHMYFTLVFCLLYVCSTPAFGQNSWSVLSYGKYEKPFLEEAMAKGRWDSYRKLSTPVIIQFSNGAKVELLSANSLVSKMIPVDISQVKPDDFEFPHPRTFSIDEPTGIIIEKVANWDERPGFEPKVK